MVVFWQRAVFFGGNGLFALLRSAVVGLFFVDGKATFCRLAILTWFGLGVPQEVSFNMKASPS